MKMLATIIAVGVGVLLLVFQYILSRKKSVIWGAIIPILTILLTIWIITFKRLSINFKTLIPYILIFLILIEEWYEGRKKQKNSNK
jgi:predicted membrane protein